MPTIRQKGSRWEAIVRRKGVLPRPLSLYFDSRTAAVEYCTRLEGLLDLGIIPPEIDERLRRTAPTPSPALGAIVRQYLAATATTADDRAILTAIVLEHGGERDLTVSWADAWVRRLKRERRLAPGTIRKHVGAVSRALNWAVRTELIAGNPLASLPNGYSRYTDDDAAAAGQRRIDTARDRRPTAAELDRLFAVLQDPAERLLVTLALETAMRLSELYTLQVEQIDLTQRTAFLARTKNGSQRQVPLSTPACTALAEYLDGRTTGTVLPYWSPGDPRRPTSTRLSAWWRRRCREAQIHDLTFHDLRHEATSRLFERTRLTDLQIAKITGHKDPRMLARYANLRGSDLADQLW